MQLQREGKYAIEYSPLPFTCQHYPTIQLVNYTDTALSLSSTLITVKNKLKILSMHTFYHRKYEKRMLKLLIE
jgi:hypothetical protein